jgi:hypothetical protein
LRDYITRNQEVALSLRPQIVIAETTDDDSDSHPDGVPDFGQMVQELTVKKF